MQHLGVEQIACELARIGAVRFGTYTLKSGVVSPIYIDLRMLVAHPQLLNAVALSIAHKVESDGVRLARHRPALESDVDVATQLCGVPYTALPIATAISIDRNIPMVMRRKEVKSYGTKRAVQGDWQWNEQCLVIEDLITSYERTRCIATLTRERGRTRGSSVLETVEVLKDEGLNVRHCAMVVDREQGGKENLNAHGIEVHALFTVSEMLEVLVANEYVDNAMRQRVQSFVRANQVPLSREVASLRDIAIPFKDRAISAPHPLARQLFSIMESKKSNLCVAIDVTSSSELLRLARLVAPHCCMVKTHFDIVVDFSGESAKELVALSEEEQFLLLEDRKYADIGNTLRLQYSQGETAPVQWSHVVTVHSISGNGALEAIRTERKERDRGVLLLAEMSSKGSLATGAYTTDTVSMSEENMDVCLGLICQRKLSSMPGLVHCTPGVRFACEGDTLGQQYNTPDVCVYNNCTDVIIVGRGITQAEQPAAEAQRYKEAAWKAYERRVADKGLSSATPLSFSSALPQWHPFLPPIYDMYSTYEENLANGPRFPPALLLGSLPAGNSGTGLTIGGVPIRSRIGVAAGPLLDSRWTTLAARLGFDLVTYKTIRTKATQSHPLPNVTFVDGRARLSVRDRGHVIETAKCSSKDISGIAITNSFGMPSQSEDVLRRDIRAARDALEHGQVLTVSVTGSAGDGGVDEMVEDFARCALLAKESGAQLIEANFSCPNVVSGEGSVFTSSVLVERICRAIVQAVDDTPLFVKVGVFENEEIMADVFRAAAQAGARGISGINTLSMKVIDSVSGHSALGSRVHSGVCGAPIKELALQFARAARAIVMKHALDLQLIVCGGVCTPQDGLALLEAGADIVTCATGMMWDPYLAARFHQCMR